MLAEKVSAKLPKVTFNRNKSKELKNMEATIDYGSVDHSTPTSKIITAED